MFRPTTVILPIALMAFALVYYLLFVNLSISAHQKTAAPKIGSVACTEEAKLCPDGSAVGRTGPNCEFAECPATNMNAPQNTNTIGNKNLNTSNTNTTEILCAADVRSCSDGSYVQRVPPTCVFAECPSGTQPVPPDLP